MPFGSPGRKPRRERQLPEGEALQPRRRKGWRPRPLAGLASSPFARRYSGSLDVDFLSSGYLDVSVPPVVPPGAMRSPSGCRHCWRRVRPFGDPGVKGCVPLARDYRSLPRPSSAPCAKASAVRPGYLPAHRRDAVSMNLNKCLGVAHRHPGGPGRRSCRCNLLFSDFADWKIASFSQSKRRIDQIVSNRSVCRYAALKVRGVDPGDRTREGASEGR